MNRRGGRYIKYCSETPVSKISARQVIVTDMAEIEDSAWPIAAR
jgi:hypothetical protein